MSDYNSYMWSVTDWRGDDVYDVLDNREKGIYRELIDQCWVAGSITSDPELLARFAREPLDYFAQVWAKIRGKFRSIENGSRLVSKRLEEDRRRLMTVRKNRKKSAKTAADARWDKHNAAKELDASRMDSALRDHAQTQTQTAEGEHISPPEDSSNFKNNTSLPQAAKAVTPPAEKRREPDEAYELFVAVFNERKTPAKYMRDQKKDFIHLAALRKTQGIESRASPPLWREACENYIASPRSPQTLADLCQHYADLIHGKLDRYGKPEAYGTHQGNGRQGSGAIAGAGGFQPRPYTPKQ
jgi:uncharacterized protein YdaU (DUF1376 family)